MAKSAGVITINLNAGTAQFIRDMASANASVKQFSAGVSQMGSHGVSGMQATSGALRVLEGGITNNLRAAERFAANVLGLGPILQAAFPVVGAIAFTGIILRMGEEVTKFFKEMREAPEKSAAAFRDLNGPIKTLNDSLELTNVKLENQIAKLEGRRQNTLKVALLEARDAADQLVDSLQKDFAALKKLLEEHEVGTFKAFMFGLGSTSDIKDQFTALQKVEAEIKRSGQARIDAAIEANDKLAVQGAQQELNTRLLGLYNRELDETNKKLAEAQKQNIPSTRTRGGGRPTRPGEEDNKATTDLTIRIQQLTDARDLLEQEINKVPLKAAEGTLKGAVVTAEATKEATRIEDLFRDRIAKLNADLSAATAKMDAVGQGEAAKVLAKANGEAIKSIEELNKAWKDQNRVVSESEAAQFQDRLLKIAATENEEAWRTKLLQTTDAIREQVRGQELLTAAVGKGYEAVKAANVETELMSKLGFSAFSDPMNRSAVDITRQNLAAAYDSKHITSMAEQADAIRDQITLETRLSQVQMQGSEAIRIATLDVTLAKLREKGATQEVLDLTVKQSEATRDTAVAKELAGINDKIEATKRLAAAQIQGAEAVRQAALANTIAELKNRPGGATNAAIDAAVKESEAQKELRISTTVADRVNLYSKHLADIKEEVEAIGKLDRTEENRLAIERSLRDLEKERIKTLSEEALAMGGARDGVRAFFTEMRNEAKTTAQSVYEALNSAVDGVAGNLSKLMTGQKTSWAQMFQGIGDNLIKDQLQGALRRGIAAVGARFGFDIGGKKDGSSEASALWVRMAGSVAGLPGAIGTGISNIPGLGKLGPLFGGSQGGGIFNFLGSLIPHAAGGPVSPSSAYLVGEHGPEILTGASGNIISNEAMRGGSTHYYSIDARGTDPVQTEARVRAAIIAAHDSAVGTSIRANQDRLRRMPTPARA